MELRFSSDTKQRKWRFIAKSFSHPAKMSLPLQLWLIQHYTKPGDWILDPMAGSGTLLIACSLSRNVFLLELEQKYVRMCEENWARVQEVGCELGHTMGQAIIKQGDARNLEEVLADIVITSPPYSENPGTPSLGSVNKDNWGKEGRDIVSRRGLERGYSANPSNLGNLKGQTYLGEMRKVYEQMYKVLKPGGLCILVVKPFIRNRKVIPLQEHTKRLCEAVGFRFVEEHYRRLTQMSFWRTLYYQKFPDVERVDKEYILVFKKDDGL